MSSRVSDALSAVERLPGFAHAQALLAADSLVSATDELGRLLETEGSKHGDVELPLGPLYFSYGSACLRLVQSSSNVFGISVKHQKEVEGEGDTQENVVDLKQAFSSSSSSSSSTAAAAVEKPSTAEINFSAALENNDPIAQVLEELMEEYRKKHNEEPTDEVLTQWKTALGEANMVQLEQEGAETTTMENLDVHEDQNENDEEKPATTLQETLNFTSADIEEYMSIAWDCLEAARVTFAKALSEVSNPKEQSSIRARLAYTRLKLGDLSMERGEFVQAIQDYSFALQDLIIVHGGKEHKRVADALIPLGIAHVYAAPMAEGTFACRAHYISSLNCFLLGMRVLTTYALENLGDYAVEVPGGDLAVCDPGCEFKEEEQETKETDETSKAPKENKPEDSNEETTPLTEDEKNKITRIREILEKTMTLVPIRADVSGDVVKAAEDVKELQTKCEDVLAVLENPEAQKELASEIVMEKLNEANSASTAFDQPSSAAQAKTDMEGDSGGPTNLLQVRKKASAPVPAENSAQHEQKLQNEEDTVVPQKRKPDQDSHQHQIKRIKQAV